MKIIIVIVMLALLGLLGIVTKSLFAILLGAAGIAISFLVFCTGLFFTLLGKIIAIILSLLLLVAAALFVPTALIVIIPAIYFAYMYVRKKNRHDSGIVAVSR